MLYVAGATIPAIFMAAIPEAFPGLASWRDHRATAIAGASITFVLVALLAAGRYDDLVAELVRRTTA